MLGMQVCFDSVACLCCLPVETIIAELHREDLDCI